jgi:hypothetical protein
MHHFLRSTCLGLTIFGGSVAFAQTDVPLPSRVLDTSLKALPARPFVIEEMQVLSWDGTRELPRTISRNEVLAVMVGPESSRSTNARWNDVVNGTGERSSRWSTEIHLTDGQILPGNIIANDETLQWRHKRLGEFDLDLERVSAFRLVPGAKIPEANSNDVIILSNGDRLEGLVMELADPLPIEQVDDEGKLSVIEVPMERVASAALVNPSVPPQGVHVWLSDGTIFSTDDLRVGDDGYVQFIRPGLVETREIEMAVEYLRGILFDPARVIPFASLEAKVDAGSAEELRAWSPPPVVSEGRWPLNASRIRLEGPLRARWTLPRSGCTFATTAELPQDAMQGVFDLVVRDGGKEVLRVRMDQDHPIERIVHRMDSRELEIELEMADSGPVHVDLYLHEAILLLPSPGR